jgi:Uncharacterized protein conserved in bacteria
MLTRLAPLLAALAVLASPALRAEMRAAWVASVHNINFPSKYGLSAEAQKREIIRILDTAKRANLNALMVQVRPECDALYESRLEPWSKFLTGTQGRSPGYDPLEFFITEGRKRGIAIHAWLNPYRAATSVKSTRASNHASNRLGKFTRNLGKQLWLDPGAPEVQDHVVNVVADIVRRYAVAGVHLDDYFYPYPENYKGEFPDAESYARYQRGGGKLSRADWRRHSVNRLVQRLGETVRAGRPGAVFGISPFGIYTKGQPADVKAGLDQLNQLYADPVMWMRQGWVDYLAPQLYWKDDSPQSFTKLLRWWRSPQVNPRQIPIYPGIAIERIGGSHNWPATEIARQLQLEETIGPRRQGGFILWDFKPLLNNQKGILDVVR